jgi:hypothetical protein|tara:strand:+ start:2601 stop:2765 length:165 start_codon:yes stop_codon:yes gene_type:complete
MSYKAKSGKSTIGTTHATGKLTPVASLGSKQLTNGERMPVKTTGGGVGFPKGKK